MSSSSSSSTPSFSSNELIQLRTTASVVNDEECVCQTCKRTFQMENSFHREYRMCTSCKEKTLDGVEHHISIVIFVFL